MKKLNKFAILLLIAAMVFNCSKDDDNNAKQNQLLGKWEVTSGIFLESQPEYLIFNTDNTISFLLEHSLGFKSSDEITYSLSASAIEMNIQGVRAFEYTLNENILTIINGSSSLELIKNSAASTTDDWIEELSILSKGNTPWSGAVDIAFTYDKTKIVYGMSNTATYIPLIDPATFTEVGQIATTNIAKVVEIENFELPDRYRFESNDNSNLISVSSVDGSIGPFNIDGTGVPFDLEVGISISGMASVDNNYLWVASNVGEGRLNLVNVADNTIEQTIPLDVYNLNGLDYQDGFLYVADGVYLHKCQTEPSFKAITTYKVTDLGMEGIAFDGTNFWASGFDKTESSYKLIKTSLTL